MVARQARPQEVEGQRMSRTSIQWTAGDDGSPGRVWNCLRGCSRISPGCGGGTPGPNKGGCYAEAIAERFSGPGQPFEGFAERGKGWTRKVALIPEKLGEPLGWKKPCRVFANSMSDAFHEGLPNEDIAAMFGVMAACPHLTFQVLTKRATRMRAWFAWLETEARARGCSADFMAQQEAWKRLGPAFPLHKVKGTIKAYPWPLPNVWLGVSTEDQQRADERIPELLETPAAVRFLSVEPMLSQIDLSPWIARIDQVIWGGESGPGSRPFDVAWGRSIVEQCRVAGTKCFSKQIGARPVDDARMVQIRDRKGGSPDEWPPGDWPREFPVAR